MPVGIDPNAYLVPRTVVYNGETVDTATALTLMGIRTRADITTLGAAQVWAANAIPFALAAVRRTSGDVKDRYANAANLYSSAYYFADQNPDMTDGQKLVGTLAVIVRADGVNAEALRMEKASATNAATAVSHAPPDDPVVPLAACDAKARVRQIDRDLAGTLTDAQRNDNVALRQQYEQIVIAAGNPTCEPERKSNWIWWAVGGTGAAGVIGTLVWALAPERKRKRAQATAGSYG